VIAYEEETVLPVVSPVRCIRGHSVMITPIMKLYIG
jgi:hypothetical protein